MFKRILFFLLVIVLFTGCSTETSPNTTKEEQDNIPTLLRKPEPWGNAPNFIGVRIGGGEFRLSSLRGKVILLNFWSVDCPACKMQIPIFAELYKQYKREELEIIGVCLDSESIVKRFIKSVDMNYILVLVNQDIANKYGRNLRFLPLTLTLDRQGDIAEKHVGFTSANVFEKEIKGLLEKAEDSVK